MPDKFPQTIAIPPVGQFGRNNRTIHGSASGRVTPTSHPGPPITPGVRRPMRFVTIPLDLSVARTRQRFPVSGACFWFLDSVNGSTINSPTDLIQVCFSDETNPDIPARPGFGMENIDFSAVYISNAAIAGSQATLLIFGEPDKKDDFAATNAH